MNNPNGSTVNLALRTTVDQQSARQGVAAINSVTAAIEAAKQAGHKMAEDAKAVNLGIAQSYEQVSQAANKAAQQALNAEKLRRTGGALSQLGASGPGQVLSRVGDVVQIQQEFGALKAAVGGEITKIGGQLNQLPGLTGKITSAASGLVAGLGPIAGGIASVLVVAAPVAVAIAGIALAFKAFQDQANEQAKVLKSASESVTTYFEAIQKGTKETISAQLKNTELQIQYAKDELKIRQEARDKGFESAAKNYGDLAARIGFGIGDLQGRDAENLKAIDALKERLNGLGASADGLARALTAPEVKARTLALEYLKDQNDVLELRQKEQALLKQSSTQLEQRLKDIDAEKENIRATIDALMQGPDSDETVARMKELNGTLNKLEQEEHTINRSVLDTVRIREMEKKAIDDTIKSIGTVIELRKLQAERQDTLDTREREARRKALEDQKKAADEAIAEQDRAEASAKAHAAILEDLRKRTQDLDAAYAKEEQRARAALAKSIGQLSDSFQQSQIKSEETFHKAQLQAEAKYQRDRLRAETDLHDQLLEDAAQSDVAKLISDYKAGKKNLERMDESHAEEVAQREEAHAEQQAEARKNYAEQLAALQKNFAEQEAERAQNYAEQLAALRKDARERTAVLNQQEAEDKARRERDKQREREYQDAIQRIQDEENAARIAKEDAAYQERLTKLQTALTNETSLITNAFNGLGLNVETSLNGILNRFNLQLTPQGGGILGKLFGGVFGGSTNSALTPTNAALTGTIARSLNPSSSSSSTNISQSNSLNLSGVTPQQVEDAFARFAGDIVAQITGVKR